MVDFLWDVLVPRGGIDGVAFVVVLQFPSAVCCLAQKFVDVFSL